MSAKICGLLAKVALFYCLLLSIVVNAADGLFRRPTDWTYKDEVYDAGKKGYEPNCRTACNGEVANGKPKKCRFGDYCDGNDSTPYHAGIDYQNDVGSDIVRSTAPGKVIRIVQNGRNDHGLGNVVILKHYCAIKKECPPSGTVYSLYAHLAYINESLVIGEWLPQGEAIGVVGGTASGETNYWPNHLHFELKQAPVLHQATSKEYCMHTAKIWHLFPYQELSYGYTPVKDPSNCGYLDPELFIGKVLVRDLSGVDTAGNLPVDYSDGSNGEFGIKGFGYAYGDIAEQEVALPPDLITKKVWLETPWGVETYKYGKPEIMKMKAQFANVGSGDVPQGSPSIEAHFYLSKGYKEDRHSGDGHWVRVGTDFIRPENLKVGDTHTETEGIELWRDIPEPGIWNIVACIDHVRDDHNNGGAIAEKHESNNCSTEAVFEVTADGKVVNAPDADFVASGLHFRGAPPVYAGDRTHFGATITNQGTMSATADIRSSYRVQCPGTGLIYLADDGTPASSLYPGASAFEENIGAVTLPNVSGTCTAYFCADYQGAVQETDETNNCTSLSFVLQPRPAPRLAITKFKDESGCCTTNTGSRIKPDIWVRNDGSVSPGSNVTVIYQINSPVATGGAWQTIGYGSMRPSELPPGGTDEDYMDGSWSIPKSSAWKKQWHTIRACLKADGSAPAGDPNRGDICAVYTRYSKK